MRSVHNALSRAGLLAAEINPGLVDYRQPYAPKHTRIVPTARSTVRYATTLGMTSRPCHRVPVSVARVAFLEVANDNREVAHAA